jgi:hypothetical protein
VHAGKAAFDTNDAGCNCCLAFGCLPFALMCRGRPFGLRLPVTRAPADLVLPRPTNHGGVNAGVQRVLLALRHAVCVLNASVHMINVS